MILSPQDDAGNIRDVFPMDQPDVARDLLAMAVQLGRRQGLSSLTFTFLKSNPLLPSLQQFGFRQRSGFSQMYGYAPESSALRPIILDADSWWLTVGDRDV